MVRTLKTRFATAFLTLKWFKVEQANLRKIMTSEKWVNSRFSKEAAGKRVAEVILMPSFWKTIVYALKAGGPLVKVMRLVDGEKKFPMGYIYEAMDRAKDVIAASFNQNEKKYRRVFDFIDDRWTIQLHRPLHAVGYFLNPEFLYPNPDVENDAEVMEGLYKCISRLVIGYDLQDKITTQLEKYKKAEGFFCLPMAVRQRSLKSPADWWSYGASTPELKTFAMKILNLTCSSSGYERNWSFFEHALMQALGDRKGINRFGDFSASLDEALIHVSLDLSGRPYLGYDLHIPTERVGTYDTQLVEHFFQSLVNTSGMTLHIRQLAGNNSHHIIEATFKAFARALRQATEYDRRRRGSVPSSKGVLSRS